MENYRPRIADKILKYRMEEMGAVLIEGPKWCGKSTTAAQQAKSALYIADPTKQKQYFQMAEIDIRTLLNGDTPRLLDEWQLLPQLWDAVRFEIDQRQSTGQFIFTGSSVPVASEKIIHSGTGRFAWIKMRPMTLFESGESTGEISLTDIFNGKKGMIGNNSLDLRKIAFLTCRGGWPGVLDKSDRAALHIAFDYYDAIIKSDISRVDGVERNAERTKLLMRSYSRNQGTQASINIIQKDMMANDESSISEKTTLSYINALKKMFVIEDMPAWNPNIRSKTSIRTSDTRYFVDPSIAVATLGLGPDDLINDLETFGLMFETLCVRDLRVYADAMDGNVYHYRDKDNLECDAVIHLRNGSYGLVEIKLGGDDAIEYAVKTLSALAQKIDTTKMKQPSFLMVLTAVGDYAYQRKDGVWIVPVGCLKD